MGLRSLFPSSLIDDYLFEPCGYSMNGLDASGGFYTIHVTPEKEGSYASFETNIKGVVSTIFSTIETNAGKIQ